MSKEKKPFVSKGVQLIQAERARQISEEGWTPKHDRQEHQGSEIALMGACYALIGARPGTLLQTLRGPQPTSLTGLIDYSSEQLVPDGWYLKPKGQIENLVRAGALIAAELDRLTAGQEGL